MGVWIVGLLIGLVTAGNCQVWAQETATVPDAQAPRPSHRIPWNPVDALGMADPLRSWSVEIYGLLATNYTFNFNEPASGKNGLLLMNRKHNHFDLDLANVRLQRIVASGLGFVIDLDFGKTAEVTGRATRWYGNPRCGKSRNSFELMPSYLTYNFLLGGRLSVSG